MTNPRTPEPPGPDACARALASVAQALGRMSYGDIRLTVHDGRIVQIEVTEKTRFDQR